MPPRCSCCSSFALENARTPFWVECTFKLEVFALNSGLSDYISNSVCKLQHCHVGVQCGFFVVYLLDSDTKVKHFWIEIAPLVPILYIRSSKIINVIGNSEENFIRRLVFIVLFTILLFFRSFDLFFSPYEKFAGWRSCYEKNHTHKFYFKPQNNRKRNIINLILICARNVLTVDIKLFSIPINNTWKENNLNKLT